jgi:hypothetical protein
VVVNEERRLYEGKTVEDLRDAIEDALADMDSVAEIVEYHASTYQLEFDDPDVAGELMKIHRLIIGARDRLRSAR